MDLTNLIRKNILALEPYSTARDDFQGAAAGEISVWLDANESPYPNGVNRYPDPHQRELKERVGQLFGVPGESIFLGGSGSDEAIDLAFRIFCEPGRDNVVSIAPSYGVYAVAAAVNDVELRAVELNADFSLPIERLLAATDSHTKLLWLCSPNNPTGNAFARADILRLARRFEGMVVVDEAYADFADEPSVIADIPQVENLLVLRTFSKAWGMAGLRCGMAFGRPEVISYFGRVKYPYNMSSLIQRELLGRLRRVPSAAVAEIKSERAKLARALTYARCVEHVYPSQANFLLVKVADARRLYDYLVANGVIVRNRSRLPLCDSCLRITIGTPAENARTLRLIMDYK